MPIYETPAELDTNVADHLLKTFADGEEFIVAVGGSRWGGLTYRYHIVTNRRFIEAQKIFTAPSSSDTDLSDVSRVELDYGTFKKSGKLTLTGIGFEETYLFTGDDATALANALREQIAKKEGT